MYHLDQLQLFHMEQTVIKDPPPKKMSYSVIKDDITKVQAEAVVTGEGELFSRESAVTQSLTVVMPQLQLIRSKIRDNGGLDLWTAHVSQLGAGSGFKYVIHAVLDKGNNDQWLRFMKTLYTNIFKAADKYKISSIALPVLGSGTSDSDRGLSIQAVASSVLAYSSSYINEVKVVTNDQDLLNRIQVQIQCERKKGSESSKGILKTFVTGFTDVLSPSSYYDRHKADTVCSGADRQVQRAVHCSKEEEPVTRMKQTDELQKTNQQSDESVRDRTQRKEKEANCHSQWDSEQYTGNVTLTRGNHGEHLSKGSLQLSEAHAGTGDTYQQDYVQGAKTIEGYPDMALAAERSNEVKTLVKTSEARSANNIQLYNVEADSQLKELSTAADDSLNLVSSPDQETDVNTANGKDHDKPENTSSELDDREKDLSVCEHSSFKHLIDNKINTTSDDLKRKEAPEKTLDDTEDNTKTSDSKYDSVTTCPICLSTIIKPKKLDKCGHIFCQDCIDQSCQDYKHVCPSCNMVYGVITGNQPEGNMDVGFSSQSLPGYQHHGTITITYSFPSGIQKEGHPNPRKPYKGTTRRAYLPDCREGRETLALLETAFDRKLTFTIGRSTTTGQENVVTWNDTHNKTNMDGGPTRFGYPDPTYLDRVRDEMASKGVTK